MKHPIFVLISLLMIGLYSCKKHDPPAPDTSAAGEYFNCELDGTYWTYRQCSFCNADALYARPEVVDYPHFAIRAMSSEDPTTVYSFMIDTAAFNRLDSIDLSTSSKSCVIVTHPYPLQAGVGFDFTSISGKLVFTSKNAAQVSGIFEFEATDGSKIAHVTNRKFLIKRS